MSMRESRVPAIGHKSERRDEGSVHTLTVANPKKLNVLTAALMDELRDSRMLM